MAVTSTIEYCSDRDLLDVYPGISTSDSKIRIYSWVVHSGSLYRADNCGVVTQLFVDGQDLGSAEANSGVVNVNGEWYYDDDINAVYYYNSASNPNDLIMESGEDASTFRQRMRRNASRLIDSKLDARLSREVWRDREGNYPFIMIRTASLIAVSMILRTEDPTNVVAQAFDEEASENLEGLNQGSIQLPNKVTMDSSKGFIRDVTYTAGSIRPVDTRGAYNGTYDLLKIIINTAGVIGTAKYDVYEKSSTNLKSNQIVTAETINGDYQELAGGLQIRFAGSTDSSVATQNNEFEMEVFGAGERVDTASTSSMRLTRDASGYAGSVKGGYLAAGFRRFKI